MRAVQRDAHIHHALDEHVGERDVRGTEHVVEHHARSLHVVDPDSVDLQVVGPGGLNAGAAAANRKLLDDAARGARAEQNCGRRRFGFDDGATGASPHDA